MSIYILTKVNYGKYMSVWGWLWTGETGYHSSIFMFWVVCFYHLSWPFPSMGEPPKPPSSWLPGASSHTSRWKIPNSESLDPSSLCSYLATSGLENGSTKRKKNFKKRQWNRISKNCGTATEGVTCVMWAQVGEKRESCRRNIKSNNDW